MDVSRQRTILAGARCETRFDALTRQLFATDASVYQVEPLGVAFPQGADQAVEILALAAEAGVEVIPRGAGTGLAGGALGRGLVIDFSRRNRDITEFDAEARTVRVGPGVVLDQLNAYLRPHGFRFGPDVATSSRATLGGMIGNNSSGSHVPVYGTTVDHVRSLDILLADGRLERVGRDHDTLPALRSALDALVNDAAPYIREHMPEGLSKRWHGYGLDRYLAQRGDLSRIVAGSEGTLAAIVSAELDIVPLPKRRGIALVFFASVAEAMQASVELLDLQPAAIEHIDRVLFDQTKGQLAFREARGLLELDDKPCESILIVDFFEEVSDKLREVKARNLGIRTLALEEPKQMDYVWGVRKAGLSLLTGCPGATKPVPGIEDAAVRPEQLPDYVAALQGLFAPLNMDASFYGHAASGLLHVRPVLDLHKADEIAQYRKLADDVSAIVKQFKGSIAGEHGVGMARTEFLPDHLGPELMEVLRATKQLFDPSGRMNPGKIVPDGRCRYDQDLRWGPAYEIRLPFEPRLRFAAKDHSFVGNLEQCNGCGGCRKDAPTMCPTYVATGEEIMSTRGRANTIRALLDGRIETNGNLLHARELDEALSNCLSCKACTKECPSNVNMALLKAELLHARHQLDGIPLSARLTGYADVLATLASLTPGLANRTLRWPWFRHRLRRLAGITEQRPMPPYAKQRFDRWFRSRRGSTPGLRGQVLLWDDTFVRHNEPHIGQAAVAVLEAAGYTVRLVNGRACCGRPAFSSGLLNRAARLGAHNLDLVRGGSEPVLFLEPSCYSMFIEDYRELGLDGAEDVAQRCILFEAFIASLLDAEPDALTFADGYNWVAIHAHCHAKSLTSVGAHERLAKRLPNASVTMLNTGCCGMAGSFGMQDEKLPLSMRVARPLVEQIQELQAGTCVVASGTSCRHQIDYLTDTHAVHMAELLAENLRKD